MKQFILVLPIILFLACGTTKNNSKQVVVQEPEIPLLKAAIGKGVSQLETTITEAQIQGNELHLTVTYPGGCEVHKFKMVGSNVLAKSLPPIRNVSLLHSVDLNEACEKLVTQKLRFDIRDLAEKKEAGSVIKLTLNGWKEVLTYTFE